MDFVTLQVRYVQDSSIRKPLPLLDISRVTAEDRARVLGARRGSPRYAPPGSVNSWSEKDQNVADGDDDLDCYDSRDVEVGAKDDTSEAWGDLCAKGHCSCLGTPVFEVSWEEAKSLGATSSQNRSCKESRTVRLVIPEGAGPPSPNFLAKRAELLGSKCGSPRASAALTSSEGVKKSSSCKDCSSEGLK